MDPCTVETLQAIEETVAGMSAEEMTGAPEGKWSTESILEHLDLTFSGTAGAMRKHLAKGPPPLKASLRDHLARWLIVDIGYFPTGFRAPEFVVPRGGRGAIILENIRTNLHDMDAAIAACEQAFGPQTTFKHPRLGPLTSAQWRRFHLIHTRHHMKQIAALRTRR